MDGVEEEEEEEEEAEGSAEAPTAFLPSLAR